MFATDWLERLPLYANLAIFATAAAGVWLAARRLPLYADEICDRFRIGHAFAGLVFLAGTTQLPEIVTTLTGAVAGYAPLLLNNLFGGIVLQTAILAVADLFAGRAPLTSYPRKSTPILESSALILLLTLLLAIVTVGESELFANIGVGAVFLAAAYCAAIYILRSYDQQTIWTPVEVSEALEEAVRLPTGKPLTEAPSSQIIGSFAAAAAVILLCGVVLVAAAETIAIQSGIGESFIGATLLAAVTSLPEIAATVAAVRIGAYTMALSNIFGANLIVLALILPADILFRGGPILQHVDRSAQFALIAGILTTAFFTCGLVLRTRFKLGPVGLDSACVFAIYLVTVVIFYALR